MNILWIAELLNLEHYWLSRQGMSHLGGLNFALTDLRAHGHMICSSLAFKAWYDLLVWEVGDVVRHEEILDTAELPNKTKTVF